MMVITAGKLLEEVGKIVLFGKPGKLAARMQTDIDQPLDAVLLEQGKELPRRLFSKANGVDFHTDALPEQALLLRLVDGRFERAVAPDMLHCHAEFQKAFLGDQFLAVAALRVFLAAHDHGSSFLG